MSEHLIRTQERSARKHHESAVSLYDPFQPQSHVAPASEVAFETRYIQAIGSDAFGQTLEYHLPLNAMLGEVWLRADLGALSSGNYADYAGANLIETVQLRSGSNVLMEFDYAPVMACIMSRMTAENRTEMKAAFGGTGMASGGVLVPLPFFWTKMQYALEFTPPPLNAAVLASKLIVRLKLRSAADVAASGATVGSPTISTRLYYQEIVCATSLRNAQIEKGDSYAYSGYDWQTIVERFTVATGSSTNIDISDLHGSLAEVFFQDALVTDWTTAHEYMNSQGDVDELKIKLDGKDYQVIEFKENLRFEQMLVADRKGVDADFSSPVSIQLGLGYDGPAYTGGLAMDSVNKLSAQIKHSAGADCYINVVARVKSYYVVSGGNLARQL